MSLLDLGLALALLLAGLLGFYWGLLRQVIALSALLVGVLAGQRLGPIVGGWLSSFTADQQLAAGLGFALALLTVSLSGSLIASALRLYVGLLFLGRLDHLLGAGLGLLKALLLSALALALLGSLSPLALEQTSASWLGPTLARLGGALIGGP